MRRVPVIVGTVFLFVTVLPAQPALASNWGSVCDNSVDCVSMANTAIHVTRNVNLSDTPDAVNGIPGMAVAIDWAISQYNATDMTVYRDESNTEPDVWMHDYKYGDIGWVGITKCPTNNSGTGGTHPNRWCRGQQNIFNSYYYWYATGAFDDAFQRRRIACHEMGHTVGLRHNTVSTLSCIWPRYWEAPSSILHSHDIAHINSRW